MLSPLYKMPSNLPVFPVSLYNMLGKNFSRHFEIHVSSCFSHKIRFNISCKLSWKVTTCMKCQILFSAKDKKNIISWIYLMENFFFFFLFGFYGPFKNISLISSRSFIKGGQKPENLERNHLTICKQNLAFPHVTRARLEPQRWET